MANFLQFLADVLGINLYIPQVTQAETLGSVIVAKHCDIKIPMHKIEPKPDDLLETLY